LNTERTSLYMIRAFGLFAALLGSLAQAEKLQGKLTLTGSSTVAPLAAELGKKFETLHPGTRIDVQSGGSSRGISDARQGLADIGMVSRALKPEEKDLIPHTVAKDGICIILHKSNPVSVLNDSQLVAVYTGKITNWKALGGKDAPITFDPGTIPAVHQNQARGGEGPGHRRR
jgi:phosphate transport system substrate-binding protein